MQIRIHGIANGKHIIKLENNVKKIPDIFPEFIGDVELDGTLTKTQNRFHFIGKAKCKVQLVCDFCLEEYLDIINADVETNFIVSSQMYFMQKDSDVVPDELALHEDTTHYDITLDVKDSLVLSLPMRCLCSNCNGKTFAEIRSNTEPNNKPIDPRWSKLKDIKL